MKLPEPNTPENSPSVYTWHRIRSQWLLDSESEPSAAQSVEAFNQVASLFGEDWVEATRNRDGWSVTGASPTLEIVVLGTMLGALSDVEFSDTFLTKLRERSLDSRAELEAMYLLHTLEEPTFLDYEPIVAVGDTIRKPDFRVSLEIASWVYVEVTRPLTSEAQAEVNENLRRLSSAVEVGSHDFAVEVFLAREPEDSEVEEIYALLTDSQNRVTTGLTSLANGLGELHWNIEPPGQFTPIGRDETYRPRIGVVSRSVGGGMNRQIAVRWPFADKRAGETLKKEAKQLPVGSPGLVMVQTSAASGAMSSWAPLIERRFQPHIHTRVSAVCLWASQQIATPAGEAWRLRAQLIVSPYARNPLPNWVVARLQRYPPD